MTTDTAPTVALPIRDQLIAVYESQCAILLADLSAGNRDLVRTLALAVIASSLLHSSDAEGVLHVVTEDNRP